jgi:hypothetical protein
MGGPNLSNATYGAGPARRYLLDFVQASSPRVNYHMGLHNPPSVVRKHSANPQAGFEPGANEKPLGLFMLTAYLELNSEK